MQLNDRTQRSPRPASFRAYYSAEHLRIWPRFRPIGRADSPFVSSSVISVTEIVRMNASASRHLDNLESEFYIDNIGVRPGVRLILRMDKLLVALHRGGAKVKIFAVRHEQRLVERRTPARSPGAAPSHDIRSFPFPLLYSLSPGTLQ